MDFFTAPLAQVTRWLSYTARQHIFEGLRARAEGETSGFPRKDAKGIPLLFVPDLEVNRLLLYGKASDKLMESIPHLGDQLDTICCRRLEVITTGAIRTQVRLNAAHIKTPQGLDFSRICPHCTLDKEAAEHILWECPMGSTIRAEAKTHFSQVLLNSPARAGIPTDAEEWPPLLRAFGIIGLEKETEVNWKSPPTERARGPRHLMPIDYVQLLRWRSFNNISTRRRAKHQDSWSIFGQVRAA